MYCIWQKWLPQQIKRSLCMSAGCSGIKIVRSGLGQSFAAWPVRCPCLMRWARIIISDKSCFSHTEPPAATTRFNGYTKIHPFHKFSDFYSQFVCLCGVWNNWLSAFSLICHGQFVDSFVVRALDIFSWLVSRRSPSYSVCVTVCVCCGLYRLMCTAHNIHAIKQIIIQ